MRLPHSSKANNIDTSIDEADQGANKGEKRGVAGRVVGRCIFNLQHGQNSAGFYRQGYVKHAKKTELTKEQVPK